MRELSLVGRQFPTEVVSVNNDRQDYGTVAECRDADPTIFFPEDDEGKSYPERSSQYENIAKGAIAFCQKCPVKNQCLEDGLSEPYGIWGGLRPSQRKSIERRLQRRARPISLG